jgi:hypothetical protein
MLSSYARVQKVGQLLGISYRGTDAPMVKALNDLREPLAFAPIEIINNLDWPEDDSSEG